MKYIFSTIKEYYNKIFNIKKIYKCIAYIDNGTGDKLVDAFEITDFSERIAYNTAIEVLKLKYPNMGFNIRLSEK